jgi:hypothetical protein
VTHAASMDAADPIEAPTADGPAKAMTVSILVVVIVIVLCLGLVWLLPRAAPAEVDSDMTSQKQNQRCRGTEQSSERRA